MMKIEDLLNTEIADAQTAQKFKLLAEQLLVKADERIKTCNANETESISFSVTKEDKDSFQKRIEELKKNDSSVIQKHILQSLLRRYLADLIPEQNIIERWKSDSLELQHIKQKELERKAKRAKKKSDQSTQ